MNELVTVKNDQAICTSLQIAESFEKRHDHVLRDIENLIAQNWGVKSMFNLTTRRVRGKDYPMYEMNRDGFSLLVMGFTGEKALEWKIKYIQAFNQMESSLSDIYSHKWLSQREQGKITRKAETDMIQKFVEYAKESGSENSNYYYTAFTNLANKLAGVPNKGRNDATLKQLNQIEMMENIIMHCIDEGIVNEAEYHQVYKNCKNRLDSFMEIAYLTAS